jgi:glycosyltransferase involved in cell wall biosynthesis
MKVALIDPSLFTWPYDAALSLGLHGVGHSVTIFGKPLLAADAGPAHGMLSQHFYRRLAQPRTRHLPRPLFLGLKGGSHIFAMRRLVRELAALRPDVIHFQWTPLPAVDRWFIPALRRIAPLVLTVHDSAPFNGAPRSALQMLGAVSILKQFDRLVVHTEAAARRLGTYGIAPERIVCIAHGPLGTLAEIPAKPAAAVSGPLRILLFGRIKPYKGSDLLLRAAAALPRELLRQCQIQIIGQPFMDLAPLEQIVRDENLGEHVQIEPRFVAESEVASILGAADIITLPYRDIDASGVLMTALTAGVPIVATRVGLFAELLEDGKHGRLIPVDDHLALARALEELIRDPQLRARMGAQVRALRDEIPDWTAIAAQTTQLYQELVRERGQPSAPARTVPGKAVRPAQARAGDEL